MTAPRITNEYIRGLIMNGQGQGFGNFYIPWIEIRRWNPSPVSLQVVANMPGLSRRCSFLSKNEWHTVLALYWAGLTIREQYPIWPGDHPHPHYGLCPDFDTFLPVARGMREICTDIGINLGTYPGTRVPYVWTIDFMVTVPTTDGTPPGVSLISGKTISQEYLDPDPISRQIEKLEGERRYAKEIGANYLVADSKLLPKGLTNQIEWLSTFAHIKKGHFHHNLLNKFLDDFSDTAHQSPPNDWIKRMQLDYRVSRDDAHYIAMHCIWHQYIDCVVTRPVRLDRVPSDGGRVFRDRLFNKVQGDIA